MSQEIACALAALVCYGCADIVYKRAADSRYRAETFLMVQTWLFCPAAFAFALLTHRLRVTPPALWGALAGAFTVIGFMNYMGALRSGAVSVIAPVFRLNFIVTVVLAIAVLNEAVTIPRVAGCAMALLAGWLLLGGQRTGDRRGPAAMRRPLIQVGIATLAMGAANICHKLGLSRGVPPETMLSAQAVIYGGMVTAIGVTRNGVRIPRGVVKYSAAAAVVLLGAFLFMLYALRLGDASVVVPVSQMGFGVAAVIGMAVFKEAVTRRKIAGLGFAAGALLVLALA